MSRKKERSEIAAQSATNAMRERRGEGQTLRVEGNKKNINKAGHAARLTLGVLKSIEEAVKRRNELNEWQKGFIVDIKKKLSRMRFGPTLTEKQLKKLFGIFEDLGIRGRHEWS